MKKKLFFILFVFCLAHPPAPNPDPCNGIAFAEEKLVAAYYSDRYHVVSCKIAQKIHADDRVYYKNPEEAAAAGLVPCKKCSPPVPADFKRSNKNFMSNKKSDADSEDEQAIGLLEK